MIMGCSSFSRWPDLNISSLRQQLKRRLLSPCPLGHSCANARYTPDGPRSDPHGPGCLCSGFAVLSSRCLQCLRSHLLRCLIEFLSGSESKDGTARLCQVSVLHGKVLATLFAKLRDASEPPTARAVAALWAPPPVALSGAAGYAGPRAASARAASSAAPPRPQRGGAGETLRATSAVRKNLAFLAHTWHNSASFTLSYGGPLPWWASSWDPSVNTSR